MLTKLKETESPTGVKYIRLTKDKFAIIDEDNYKLIRKFYWRAVKSNSCWYAVARIRIGEHLRYIKMHRLIAKTPKDKVTHHLNHNSLDNRKSNLQNLYPSEHYTLNAGRRARKVTNDNN